MFYLTYIEKQRGKSGSFAQFGIFGHHIMELFNKGELSAYELCDYYIENYSKNVTVDFPPNAWVDLGKSYYDAGLEYFASFDGYDDEIISAEEKIDFVMENEQRKINFTGVVDRISKDDNGIIISDYKSKKKFKSKKEEKEYFRQLYIYCIPVFEKYGKLPYLLKFYFFRDSNKISEKLFDEKEFNNAKQFIFDTIDEIYETEKFEQNYEEFFCKYICSVPPEECDCKGQDVKGGSWY